MCKKFSKVVCILCALALSIMLPVLNASAYVSEAYSRTWNPPGTDWNVLYTGLAKDVSWNIASACNGGYSTGEAFAGVNTTYYGTPYRVNCLMIDCSKPVNRLTATMSIKDYATGAAVYSNNGANKYEGMEVWDSWNSPYDRKITAFNTLESQHTTAYYEYANIFGV